MKFKFSTLFPLFLAIGLFLCSPGAFAADSKVGFIDLQRLVNESEQGKAAAEEIRKMREKEQEKLDKKAAEIDALKADIKENSENMTLEEKRDKVQRLQDESKVYQRMAQDAKEAIDRTDKQIVAEILSTAAPVLQEIAEREKYTMIIKDKDVLAYLSASVNITDEVLAELDKSEKKSGWLPKMLQ